MKLSNILKNARARTEVIKQIGVDICNSPEVYGCKNCSLKFNCSLNARTLFRNGQKLSRLKKSFYVKLFAFIVTGKFIMNDQVRESVNKIITELQDMVEAEQIIIDR